MPWALVCSWSWVTRLIPACHHSILSCHLSCYLMLKVNILSHFPPSGLFWSCWEKGSCVVYFCRPVSEEKTPSAASLSCWLSSLTEHFQGSLSSSSRWSPYSCFTLVRWLGSVSSCRRLGCAFSCKIEKGGLHCLKGFLCIISSYFSRGGCWCFSITVWTF